MVALCGVCTVLSKAPPRGEEQDRFLDRMGALLRKGHSELWLADDLFYHGNYERFVTTVLPLLSGHRFVLDDQLSRTPEEALDRCARLQRLGFSISTLYLPHLSGPDICALRALLPLEIRILVPDCPTTPPPYPLPDASSTQVGIDHLLWHTGDLSPSMLPDPPVTPPHGLREHVLDWNRDFIWSPPTKSRLGVFLPNSTPASVLHDYYERGYWVVSGSHLNDSRLPTHKNP